jgi:hypothetical protein
LFAKTLKGSVAAAKCHTTSETHTVKGFQKNFNAAKTARKIAVYGQVLKKKTAQMGVKLNHPVTEAASLQNHQF